jgi:hypothetical protein
MCGAPISLEVLVHVLAGLVQLILVEDDVEHLGRTLRELLRGDHLHVEVPCLGLAPGLYQPVEDLRRGDLQVHDYRCQARLRQLRRMVYRIAVQHDQLKTGRLIVTLRLELRFSGLTEGGKDWGGFGLCLLINTNLPIPISPSLFTFPIYTFQPLTS